jgi:uncharacterized membrane protein
MSRFWQLIKAALVGGLGILLPILLLFLLLEEVLRLAAAIAAPVADLLLPKSLLESAAGPVAGALGFFAAAVVLGLLARTAAGKRLGRAIERNTLDRLPIYKALKGMGRGLVGDTPQRFTPVLLDYGDDTAGIVFVIEEIDDERVAVLEPWVPTPMAGNMKIVPRSRIRELDAGFGEVTAVFSRWGIGTRELIVQE